MYNLRRKGSASRRVVKKFENHLPDEIVIDVLSRLPAKDVLRCRCVCRRFKDLTSSQSFQDLHLKHCLPMILVVDDKTNGHEVTFLSDKWWEIGRKRSVTHRFAGKNRTLFPNYCLSRCSCIRFSLNGLIVSEVSGLTVNSSKKIIVLNPTNGEHVIITVRAPYSDVHGVYFHPLLKEYCTLWTVSDKWWKDVENVEYQVLNLGSNPCWKKIRNLTGKTTRTYTRIWSIAPLFINKFLYWVVEVGQDPPMHKTVPRQIDIMEFDIISEELKMMPCPVPAAFKDGWYSFCNTNLLNIEGCLSVVQINRHENLVDDINIWTLKDRAGQLWDCCNYRLDLDMYPSNFLFENGFPQAICVANGFLAIKSGSTLVAYNLKSGTTRILGTKKHTDTVQFFSHLVSFASLKNCKTDLYMDVSHL